MSILSLEGLAKINMSILSLEIKIQKNKNVSKAFYMLMKKVVSQPRRYRQSAHLATAE